MKTLLVPLAAVLLFAAGCSTTQTAGTAGTAGAERGPATDYEISVITALKEIYPGLDLKDVKVTPPSPVSGSEGVNGGFAEFSAADGMSYLYTYEIMEGNVTLERKVIRKK